MTPEQAVQMAIDALSPPRNDTETQALEALMSTFKQQAEAIKLLQTLARMTTPYDGRPDMTEEERGDLAADLDDNDLCGDAQALYDMIESARAILKLKG